ncbi:MAG: class I SAM-dependent methyltransferase [Polyangia bacterium]
MSERGAVELPAGMHESVLARFEALRQAWQSNEPLRVLYRRWYARIREVLPARELGPWIEIGSGPGFARAFIPELELTDIVRAPWHDRCVSADNLPFADASVGALVLFDVLHHLAAPARFFQEAARVLRPGGRIVLCEPYISPLSSVVYRLFHEEPVDMRAQPLAEHGALDKDPFASNQAIPTLLCRKAGQRELEGSFPTLKMVRFERLAGLSYAATGGFSRPPLLPVGRWRVLLAIEDRLPSAVYRLIGFRLLAVIERT